MNWHSFMAGVCFAVAAFMLASLMKTEDPVFLIPLAVALLGAIANTAVTFSRKSGDAGKA